MSSPQKHARAAKARRENGARSSSFVRKLNDVLAMRITMLVGSIWAFYAFVIFGLTPLLWPSYEQQILYWSNFLQLIFLPIITVGTAILSRGAQERAAADHETIRREFALIRDSHDMLHNAVAEIGVCVRDLVERTAQPEAGQAERAAEAQPETRSTSTARSQKPVAARASCSRKETNQQA